MLPTFAGPLVVDALRPLTDAPIDTHLMIVEPEQRVGKLCAPHAPGHSTAHSSMNLSA